MCASVCKCKLVSVCGSRVNGGSASKRQGNEWSHSVCGPLASAVERMGGMSGIQKDAVAPADGSVGYG